jgi:hypothetical protein
VKKIIRIIAVIVTALALLFSVAACDTGPKQSNSRTQGQKLTEQAYAQQSRAVPYPASRLKDSLERRNLRERLLRQNKPNKIGYVYYVPFGKPLGYWVIKGKVSSTQSQMTPSDEITGDLSNCSGCSEHVVAEAPGDDGSFGDNEKGVFFFTTAGAMVQVPEDDYFYSDQPISLSNIPLLNK